MNKTKKITGILCFVISIILIFLQLSFILFIKPQGYLYLNGMSALIISVLTIVFAIYPLLILIQNAKKRWILAIIILLFNLIHIFMGSDFSSTLIVSYGKNIARPIGIKVIGQSVYIMDNPIYLYGKMGNASAIPMKDENSITWLNQESAVFTYRGIDEKLHIYVSSYTNKDEISYYNIAPALQGEWKHKNELWKIGNKGIQVGSNTYEQRHITQVGAGAIILSNDFNDPQYVIVLGENFEFDNNDLPKKDSDIILWKVSLEGGKKEYTKTSNN